MGAYLSRGTAEATVQPSAAKSDVEVVADIQKVTFADPPASEAKPAPPPAVAGPVEPVLKREGAPRKSRAARSTATATPAPASIERPRTAARTPRAAAAAATPIDAVPAPEVVAAAEAAVAPPAAAVAAVGARAAKRAMKKAAAMDKAAPAAAVAAPAPELIVVGRQIRQKGAVPARKVGMKRVAKRALKPVGGNAGSHTARSRK